MKSGITLQLTWAAWLLDMVSSTHATQSQCSQEGHDGSRGNSWLQQHQALSKDRLVAMRMDDMPAPGRAQLSAVASRDSAVKSTCEDKWAPNWDGFSPSAACEHWATNSNWGALSDGKSLSQACDNDWARTQCAKTCGFCSGSRQTPSAEYVPGSPGAAWTLEETLLVKAKLWRLFSLHQGYGACDEVGIAGCDSANTARLAPKMLRLGFHDCLKYVDGTGGCDGCLQWDGVGDRYGWTVGTYSIDADDTLSHNNGLRVAVELLEALYTDPNFPSLTRPLQESLRSSGKSRADLWAFAAIVAVEYTVMVNNRVCEDPDYETGLGWGLDTNGGEQRHCNHMVGSPDCQMNLSRPLAFRTGRVDCAGTYNTTKAEHHPNAEGNGESTIEFFKQDFNFTGRETVAIMGAHTLGRLHNGHSLFKYVWVHAGGMMFNNQYYRNIVGKRDWRFVPTPSGCLQVGDAWNQRPSARWVAHVRGDKVTGGPVHWIQEKLICPEACVSSPDSNWCCSSDVPAGALCRPDGGRANGSDATSSDDDVNGGCEAYRFIPGHDEMALPAEMGLYYDFNVDQNMIPYGCPGFENFNIDIWKKDWRYTWSTIDGVKAEPGCPKNSLESPSGSTPLYEIFEEYADDPASWIRDFAPALEKMLTNGYMHNDLSTGPDQWTDIICSGSGFWLCSRRKSCRGLST
eukprot:TRINITY_DN6168_c0_g1_i1.p1 TRINITY_DN6168_c0_g1~~TRINITY_DN6168_c0_g1_i1.p1  ORF type:complete len:703 (+),score=83.65 TRINITY_DN6168_c0_g1_i1:56-2110(+)